MSQTPLFIYSYGGNFRLMGQHLRMVGTIFVPFILRVAGTCMIAERNTRSRVLQFRILQLCFMSQQDFR